MNAIQPNGITCDTPAGLAALRHLLAVKDAAVEFVAAELAWEQDRLGPQWQTAHVRLDNARRELRASLGYPVEQDA